MSEPLRAEEVYLCDGGRLVRVKPGELEALKQSDACIAKYYGLEISAPAPVAPTPIPVTRWPPPALKGSAASTEDSAPAGQGGRSAEERIGGWQRIAEAAAAPKVPRKTALPEKVSIPGDGYRDVKIINADNGEAAVYHHNR